MTTQSTVHPEAPHARRLPSDTDSRPATDTNENFGPAMKARLQQAVDTGKNRMTEWKGGFQGGIRAKPIQSVLIAAGVGAVIGLIVGRRG